MSLAMEKSGSTKGAAHRQRWRRATTPKGNAVPQQRWATSLASPSPRLLPDWMCDDDDHDYELFIDSVFQECQRIHSWPA
jgi:hypothetical protein